MAAIHPNRYQPSLLPVLRSSVSRMQNLLPLGIFLGLAAILFEIFNYSTTEHALFDALGTLGFLGIPLATILAVAFCGVDIAGITRLFSHDENADRDQSIEWYLLAAWLMAGFINAIMTWWSVSESLSVRQELGNELFSRNDLLLYAPIVVAGTVWLLRIFLIGALTIAARKESQPKNRRESSMPVFSAADRKQRMSQPVIGRASSLPE